MRASGARLRLAAVILARGALPVRVASKIRAHKRLHAQYDGTRAKRTQSSCLSVDTAATPHAVTPLLLLARQAPPSTGRQQGATAVPAA